MISRAPLFRFALLISILFIAIPSASGWTMSSWSQNPSGTELAPGTPVTAACTFHFDSWMTGSTFENDNSLIMFTDLKDPHWVVTKVEAMDGQEPIVEQVPVRQSIQVRLDGWTLSYSRKRFDVNVELTGTIPEQSGSISVVKLQEVDASAEPVAGTLIKKEVVIFVPTPEPVPVAEVTLNMTPSEIIVITPEPTVLETKSVPTTKILYSPGPEPLLVAGVLAGLLCLGAVSRRKE